MATKGEVTKENILEIAQNLMLQKSFSGASLDEIIATAHITKGGFFYHFESKNDLADMLSTIIEGGIIMSRTFSDQKILVQ